MKAAVRDEKILIRCSSEFKILLSALSQNGLSQSDVLHELVANSARHSYYAKKAFTFDELMNLCDIVGTVDSKTELKKKEKVRSKKSK